MSMNFKKSILLGSLVALVQPATSMEVEESGVDKRIHPLLRNKQETELNSTQSMEVQVVENNINKDTDINQIKSKKLEITVKGFDNLPTGRRSSHVVVEKGEKSLTKNSIVTEKKIKKSKTPNKKEINTKNLDLTVKGVDDLPTGPRASSRVAEKKIKNLIEDEKQNKRKLENLDRDIKKEKNKNTKKRKINKDVIDLKGNNNALCIKETEADLALRLKGELVSSPADWRFGVHAPLQGLKPGIEQQFSISDDSFEG